MAVEDTTKPILGSLTLPVSVDKTNGSAFPTFSARASDVGTGVNYVAINFDRSFNTGTTTTDFIFIYDSVDSFADGESAVTSRFSTATSAGRYNIEFVGVQDKAGNFAFYYPNDLRALGIATGIDVVDRSGTSLPRPTVSVTAPTAVQEGMAAVPLKLTFAELFNYTGTISVSLANESTALNGSDVSLASSTARVSISQTPGGSSYIYDLGSFATLADRSAEGTETIAIKVTATGQTFANGTDTTIVRIDLLDNAAATHQNIVNDFNGDGHGDLLWRNVNGALSAWQVGGDGRDVHQNTYFANVDPSWKIVETADFNGDNRSDILWRNDNGAFSVWDAVSSGFAQGSYTDSSVPTNWRIAGTGDVNGDGKDDLLWQRSDGAISGWNSTGSGFAPNTYFHESVGSTWKVDGLADFNGDGKDDLFWRNDNGAISIWTSTGTGFAENSYFNGSVGRSWHVVGLGDISGDGRDDILWHNDNGTVSVWRSTGSGFTQNAYSASVDPSWKVEQLADYNGDGKADILFRNDNGAISTWQSNGTGFDQNVLFNNGVPSSWTIAAHDFLL